MAIIQPKGESEITRTSTETNVLIPWQITTRIGFVCVAVLLCVYLTIWGVWWMAAGHDLEPLMRHLVRWWMAWLLPPVFAFVSPFVALVIYDYLPRLKNANWPPPYAQVDPGYGFFDAYHMPRDEPDEPQVFNVSFEGTIHEPRGNGHGSTSKHWRLKTAHPHEWQRYARALSGPLLLRPRFSVRAARRFGIPDDEFTSLAEGWARSRFAQKTSDAPNAHTRLTKWGREYMAELAASPIPGPAQV